MGAENITAALRGGRRRTDSQCPSLRSGESPHSLERPSGPAANRATQCDSSGDSLKVGETEARRDRD